LKVEGLASLSLFDIGVLLQALASGSKVGVLEVKGRAGETYLHVHRGTLKRAYSARPRAPLVDVLYEQRAAEMDDLRKAAAEVRAAPKMGPLWQYLVERGVCSSGAVAAARRHQLLEELVSLFAWDDATFAFYPEDTADRLRADGLEALGEPQPLDRLLVRCAKIVDDLAKFEGVNPSQDDVFELAPRVLDHMDEIARARSHREFVELVDGVRSMSEVVAEMRLNRYDVLQLFYDFRQKGWIRPRNALELVALVESRGDALSLRKRAQLLERADQLGAADWMDVLPHIARAHDDLGELEKGARCWVRHAQRRFDEGELDDALESVSNAVRVLPNDLEARTLQVDVLERLGRDGEAADVYRVIAGIRRRQEDLPGARLAIESSAELNPQMIEAYREWADVLLKEGCPLGAARKIRRAGDLLLGARELDAALECYWEAKALAPDSWAIRYRLVEILDAGGREGQAMQEIGHLVGALVRRLQNRTAPPPLGRLRHVEELIRRIGGLASSAAYQLGRAYVQLGEVESGEKLLRETARSMAQAKRLRSAVEIYTELLEIAPQDKGLRLELAKAWQELGSRDRALGQLRRVGAALMHEGDYAVARAVYVEMLEVDPGCLDAHRNLALALLYLGETDLACLHFRRVGMLHRASGRAEYAVPLLREAVERNPDDAALLEEYTELLLVAEGTEAALPALAQLVSVHAHHDAPISAAVALLRLLDLDPTHPERERLLHVTADGLRRHARDGNGAVPEMARELIERVVPGAGLGDTRK
jgi:tetratricopeptide (TPR) repeat protein